MSIIPFIEDYLFPEQRPTYYATVVPRRSPFTNVLNEGFRELQRLERELGVLEDDVSMDPSKGYSYKCSVAGYTPEELKVDVDGNAIVIQGQHKSSGEGQTLERTFTRRFILPPDTVKEQIQCNINEKGLLEVVAPRVQSNEQTKKHNIPIGFKSSSQAQIENHPKKPQQQQQDKQKS